MSAGLAALRLESSGARLACAGAVFIVSLANYSLTLAPAVTLVDSGELIVAARTLGVAHPPGFPLYLLLAHLATLIPIGSVAVRVNFASAVFAASASATLALVAAEALLTARLVQAKRAKDGRSRNRGRSREANDPRRRPLIRLQAGSRSDESRCRPLVCSRGRCGRTRLLLKSMR